MGTHFKKAIFDEHVQVGLVGWAERVRKKKEHKNDHPTHGQGSSHDGSSSTGLQMASIFKRASAPEGNPPQKPEESV